MTVGPNRQVKVLEPLGRHTGPHGEDRCVVQWESDDGCCPHACRRPLGHPDDYHYCCSSPGGDIGPVS